MARSLEELVKMFEESKDLTGSARKLALKCRRYYDGDQIDSNMQAELRRRKQPIVVVNRIEPKVNYLRGIEAQTRTDPKAFPRTPKHDQGAEAATDAIRYVCDNADFDTTSSECFENLIIEGVEACVIEVVGEKNEVVPRWVPWDRCFYDPHSIRRDFEDSTYNGVVQWMDFEYAKLKWPGNEASLDAQMKEYGQFGDKPSHWTDSGRRRVMICEIYFMDGDKWYRSVFTKGAILEEVTESPYLDEDGKPENAMEMQSYKIDSEGMRYGAVRVYLDSQDEVNKRRSKAMHAMNTKQTWSKAGLLEDVPKFKQAVSDPNGHLEFPLEGEFGKDFGVMPDNSMSAQQFNMYQESINQIDTIGVNAANVGNSDSKSGRAIQTLQQGGMTEMSPLFDAHAQFKKRIYRKIWNRIRQFWKEERWVRVTDDDKGVKFVGLNHPVTVKEKLEEQYGEIPADAPILQDPRINNPIEVQNRVEEIDVDIIIDEVPDVVNLQSEQFELLTQMYQANPQNAQNPNGVPWEAVVQMSTLRNKDQILGKGDPEQEKAKEEQQAAERQKQQQIEDQMLKFKLEGEMLENKKKEAEVMDKKVSMEERRMSMRESEAKIEEAKSKTRLNEKETLEKGITFDPLTRTLRAG